MQQQQHLRNTVKKQTPTGTLMKLSGPSFLANIFFKFDSLRYMCKIYTEGY